MCVQKMIVAPRTSDSARRKASSAARESTSSDALACGEAVFTACRTASTLS